MKALAVVLSLALTGSVFGQAVQRSFGSVVFPGGTSANSPGVTRNFGSVVFPGGIQTTPVYGGAPVITSRPGVGGGKTLPPGTGRTGHWPGVNGRGNWQSPAYVYAFPVYIGGYDNSYAPQDPSLQQQQMLPQQQQQPNVIVVYPSAPQQQATPVMIQAGPDGSYTSTAQAPPEEPAPAAEITRYLLAFKDHSIYSAVAYWVDGDTLHYFTTGNTHNQASMSLLDRDLTERLNREMGIDFKLPK